MSSSDYCVFVRIMLGSELGDANCTHCVFPKEMEYSQQLMAHKLLPSLTCFSYMFVCLWVVVVLLYNLFQMQHDYYMYSHSNRFTGTLTGQAQYGDKQARPFQMNTAAQHKQFHEMKSEMPSDVLELFKANTVTFLPAPTKPRCRPLDPVTTTCKDIHSMFDVPNENLVEREKRETKEQKVHRVNDQRKDRNQARIRNQIAEWNPFTDDKVQSDPEKTLLVARLNYKTTEKTLRFEFEKYGIIKSVRIIRDLEEESRGYGFVEFDNKDDFATAYKNANYRKIDGAKIVVDYECGRTLLSWRPRRFGGGKGYVRMTKVEAQALEKLERARRKEKENDERDRSRSLKRHEERRKDRSRDRGDRKDKKERRDKRDKRERRDKDGDE